MGGQGAIRLALRRPHEVGAAAALSGLVPPLDWGLVEDTNPLLRLMLKRAFGPSREDNSLRRNDLYRLMPALYGIPPELRPRLLVRAGTEDKYRFDEASYLFAMVARDNGVEVELVLEPGGHDWDYWSRTSGEVVAWAVESLEQRAARQAALPTAP
jgi:S-formylglutathione hydrolase FrmB